MSNIKSFCFNTKRVLQIDASGASLRLKDYAWFTKKDTRGEIYYIRNESCISALSCRVDKPGQARGAAFDYTCPYKDHLVVLTNKMLQQEQQKPLMEKL